jgi:Raf kinase inhibitor-like YbhB/YbcL family protein
MAQQHTPSSSGEPVAIQRITAYGEGARLQLSSPAFPANAAIPAHYSEYGEGVSPPLQWNAVPGAKAWALILQDPDAPRAEPFLHWTIWDIPGDATSLPEGLPKTARPDLPRGAVQGRNDGGGLGYFGPRPPANDRPHRYYFQLFALGKPLGFAPDVSLNELVEALKGDVIAKAELVGLYQHRTQ